VLQFGVLRFGTRPEAGPQLAVTTGSWLISGRSFPGRCCPRMVGEEDLSLSCLWFAPIGSWADAGGSLSLDGADARVSSLISCFGRRLGISGSGRMASLRRKTHFVDIGYLGSILLIY